MYHNMVLQAALFHLKQEKPNAIIVYGDYYNAYEFLLSQGMYLKPTWIVI